MSTHTMFKTTIAIALFVAAAAAGPVHAQRPNGTFTAADYFEIQELYARYTRAVDMGGCWGDGSACQAYIDTFIDGKAGAPVVNFHKRLRDEGWASRHSYSNLLVTPTAEGADGSVYALIFNVTARPPFVDHSVYYLDKLVKTPKGWKFKSREIKNNTTMKPSLPE